MINFDGMKIGKQAVRVGGDFEQIPAGGYVAKIRKGILEKLPWDSNGERLVISFDISEGEYKDYFIKQYENSNFEDKKFKGIININIPYEGSKYPESDRDTFNNFIFDVQESNGSFEFDGDERKFAGKEIGILIREEDWSYNGKTGTTTRPFKFCEADKIRTGNYKTPKKKGLKKDSTANPEQLNNIIEESVLEDLPF